MSKITEFENQKFEHDEDGFLLDYTKWNDTWVKMTQAKEGIEEMTETHWKIINILREYYEQKGTAPMARIVFKKCKIKSRDEYKLFPSGLAKGACKIAGLPKPTGCV